MYNLNYTYISDFDIDLANSYRDTSALTFFIEMEEDDRTTPLSAVTGKFVEWFFISDNPKISDLNVEFKYMYLTGGSEKPKNENSIMTYGDLKSYINDYLDEIKDNLITLFEEHIANLSQENIIPIGSFVINDTEPNIDQSWLWYKVTNRFLKEATISKPAGDYFQDAGVSRPLSNNILTANIMPNHTHKVSLSPDSKNATFEASDSASGLAKFKFQGKIAKGSNSEGDHSVAFLTSGYSGDRHKLNYFYPEFFNPSKTNSIAAQYGNTKLRNSHHEPTSGSIQGNYLTISETGTNSTLSTKKINVTPKLHIIEESDSAIFIRGGDNNE